MAEAKAFLEGKDVSPSATAAASATATAPGGHGMIEGFGNNIWRMCK